MSLFLVDGFSVSDCGVCLHCCFGIRTSTISACHNHIIICEIFICSLSFCSSPLPCLENAPSSLFVLSTYKTLLLPCCITPLHFTLFLIILASSHCFFFFFATPPFLVLSATAFPSPPNPNLVAMPSPGWHTVKLQHQPSASPAQSTARPLGMR